MKLAGHKVLITGADGFIGSHLAEELLRIGCDVRAYVFYNARGSAGWLDDLPKHARQALEVVPGDVRDPYAVRQAVRGCQVVFHLAALIGIPYSYQAPESYADTNLKGTLNILQACRELDVMKVVHTSSSEVYGTAQWVPISETHPLQAQSPYAASKIAADQFALSFQRAFGTPVAVIRPFNTYGPRQSLRAIIPTIIRQIAAGIRTLQLGATHPTRDFTYVRDTVRGFVAIGESDRSVGEVIHIGSGCEISIGELASVIAEIMSAEVAAETDPSRLRPAASEVERLWADNAKARELLGWTPQYAERSGLVRGLRETIAWTVARPPGEDDPGGRSYHL